MLCFCMNIEDYKNNFIHEAIIPQSLNPKRHQKTAALPLGHWKQSFQADLIHLPLSTTFSAFQTIRNYVIKVCSRG